MDGLDRAILAVEFRRNAMVKERNKMASSPSTRVPLDSGISLANEILADLRALKEESKG